jgi:hypothetical protein
MKISLFPSFKRSEQQYCDEIKEVNNNIMMKLKSRFSSGNVSYRSFTECFIFPPPAYKIKA